MKTGSIEKILSAHVLRGGVLYRGGVIRGRDGENHRGCYMEEYCIIVYKHRNVSGGLYTRRMWHRVFLQYTMVECHKRVFLKGKHQGVLLHNGRVSQGVLLKGKHQRVLLCK